MLSKKLQAIWAVWAQNKKSRIIALLAIVLAVFFVVSFFFFGPGPESLFMNTVGPPPEDPKARQQWLSENVDNMDHEKFVVIDEKLPSWKELDKINQSLSAKRTYPRYIKAIQTYGTLPNLVEVLYFGDVLKDLGVNTQFVHANYQFRKNKFELWYLGYDQPKTLNQDESKRALVHNILLAKQQGLAVVLFPDYYQLEDGGMIKLKISNDLESRLEAIALNLAQIAEDYHVEYLVPSNQIEMILESNGYSIVKAQQRTNAYYANVVPKIRKIYTGKIMYKMGGFGDWSNYDEISLKGADIFGFTSCSDRNRNSVEFVATDIKTASAQADKLSQKYGIPWFNAEFVISDEEGPSNYEKFKGEDPNKFDQVTQVLPIENYYKAGLDTFKIYGKNAVGFTVHSLLGSGKVYDTPAMPLIKEFFASQ